MRNNKKQKHRHLVLRLLAALLCLSSFASAISQTFTVGELNYVIDGEGATVTGKTELYDSPTLVIPDEVEYNGKQYPVISVADRAFYRCQMTSIQIPESVITIGESAFYACPLTQLTIPTSVTTIGQDAFSNIPSLKEVFFNAENCTECDYTIFSHTAEELPSIEKVIFGNRVRYIPMLFSLCRNITTVIIPESVTMIQCGAFNKLNEVYFYADDCNIKSFSVGYWSYGLFQSVENLIIGDNVKTLSDELFAHCDILNITIGNSVTTIGNKAFSSNGRISDIAIPDHVISIGKEAFSECASLETLTIGNAVQTIGDKAFYECHELRNVYFNAENCAPYNANSLPNTIESVIIGSSVKNIPDSAFYNSSELISLSIGNSVETIGASAFERCRKLTHLSIPNSVKTIGQGAFRGCPNLKDMSIGDAVTVIESQAFYGCTGLMSVTISNSVTTIDEKAFSGCTALETLTIGNAVQTIGDRAFDACSGLKTLYFNAENCAPYTNEFVNRVFPMTLENVIIGDNVKSIPDNAFYECRSMGSLTIGSSVETIGSSAFYGCRSLSSLIIPNSVIFIDKNAFSDCFSLKNAVIGECLMTIPGGLFYNCSGLVNITIPNSVTAIGDEAFSGCTMLETVTIGSAVQTIGDKAFDKCTSLKSLYFNAENCASYSNEGKNRTFPTTIKNIVFGDNVKVIPENSFIGTTALSSLVLGNSVETIGNNAFNGCGKLTDLTIPASVKEIGNYAFSGCTGLTNISMLASKAFIGSNAFNECSALTDVKASSLADWLNLTFEDATANPLYYGKNILFDGQIVHRPSIPEGTRRINSHAFVNCETFATVTLPSGLESIGESAFARCPLLQRFNFQSLPDFLGINYDNVNSRFENGNNGKIYINGELFDTANIGELEWPESMKRIPDYAFCGYGITGITVPADLELIGEAAFAGSALGYFKYDGQEQSGSVIPGNITELPKFAFNGSPISDIDLNNVTVVGHGAFSKCQNLAKVNFGNSVTTIANYAFNECSSMERAIFPESLVSLGYGAFISCSSLKEIEFLGTPATSGYCTFGGCDKISVVRIPDVNAWSQVDFDEEYLVSNPMYLGYFDQGGTSVYVKDTEVANLVLEVPEGNIKYDTFAGVKIEKARVTAEEIEYYAFYRSTLASLCLDTETIGSNAFGECSQIKEIYSMTEEPPLAPDDAFSNYDGVKLYVPVGSRSKYENAETCWYRFLDVVETDFAGIDELFKANYGDIVTGIEEIAGEEVPGDIPMEVFDLNGIHVGSSLDGLAPGLYIVRQGSKVNKLVIR